jgi:hypothetical protein
MAAWRRVALEHLPELRQVIQSSESIWELCLELDFEFNAAGREEPPNTARQEAIEAFIDWCLHAPRHPTADHDTTTAAWMMFGKKRYEPK